MAFSDCDFRECHSVTVILEDAQEARILKMRQEIWRTTCRDKSRTNLRNQPFKPNTKIERKEMKETDQPMDYRWNCKTVDMT
ncbi:unnamed protein product [Allacma fusca]|uniref:Uncharacterized protein n=1 Tax=Allacma fusca TaxID=39272 RepID=A0A8J2P1R1_9HEXA|nr:unnamed protein product [Allacma fusca]